LTFSIFIARANIKLSKYPTEHWKKLCGVIIGGKWNQLFKRSLTEQKNIGNKTIASNYSAKKV